MLQLCSVHGDDIAHEGRQCPACSEIKDLKQTIANLEDQVEDLEKA